jgi:YYY domain-containing protein
MDFGFINTILNTSYFPPQDMWLAPEKNPETYTSGFFINYYYFGHYLTAFLTKLSALSSSLTYNLTLSSLFGLTLSAAFSLGYNLIDKTVKKISSSTALVGGLISGLLLTIGGNFHTIYLFTKGYANENPIPFWHIFGPAIENASGDFFTSYWYPNATRFIPNTIHEFPSYSWVVADLHGHVLDIPFVLLTLGVLFSVFLKVYSQKATVSQKNSLKFGFIKSTVSKIPETGNFGILLLLGLLTAILYMTNAWDGLIYFGLAGLVMLVINIKNNRLAFANVFLSVSVVLISYFLFSLPFNLHFVPFVHGIGVVGGYEFLQNLGLQNFVKQAVNENGTANPDVLTFGPFIFEKGNTLSSPLWMLAVLWGFFYINVVLIFNYFISSFNNLSQIAIPVAGKIIPLAKSLFTLMLICFSVALFSELISVSSVQNTAYATTVSPAAMFWTFLSGMSLIALACVIVRATSSSSPATAFITILVIISTALIAVPEIFYVKDIYPGHYRANTMFKLGYQAFMMLSLVSGYTLVMFKQHLSSIKQKTGHVPKILALLFTFDILLYLLVMIYPYFSINSYYGVFKPTKSGGRTYETTNGTAWLAQSHPDDLKAIEWLNEQVTAEQNTIVEAVGD